MPHNLNSFSSKQQGSEDLFSKLDVHLSLLKQGPYSTIGWTKTYRTGFHLLEKYNVVQGYMKLKRKGTKKQEMERFNRCLQVDEIASRITRMSEETCSLQMMK
jgi:hypothetical protein